MSKDRDFKKISWYEMHNMTSAELKKKHKINDRQLEQGVRFHLDGATHDDRNIVYKNVYETKNK